ncbi:MAG TPA: hypothetical protein VM389_13145 [Phycisphaerae bacterium]|nr:hypothetical protein [Phycisphaerae bacterium]
MGRKRKPEPINNLVVVSDLHGGCRSGLCIGKALLDDGGAFEPSETQQVVAGMWATFWDEWVPEVCHGEPFAVVINGDALDGVHHGSVTQVSQNLSDQRRIALAALKPVREQCEGRFYVIRGTEAHVGKSAQNEETLAEELDAVPDKRGQYSRFELWIRVGRGLVHVMHHIGTTGTSHYETSAVMKELAESYAEAGRWRREPPDVVVRSHRHRHIEVRVPTKLGYGISFVTAGWQLRTPFTYRIPGGRVTTPQIGGSIIRQGDHDLYTRHRTWAIDRGEIVELTDAN